MSWALALAAAVGADGSPSPGYSATGAASPEGSSSGSPPISRGLPLLMPPRLDVLSLARRGAEAAALAEFAAFELLELSIAAGGANSRLGARFWLAEALNIGAGKSSGAVSESALCSQNAVSSKTERGTSQGKCVSNSERWATVGLSKIVPAVRLRGKLSNWAIKSKSLISSSGF
jgi:hypothetical protein